MVSAVSDAGMSSSMEPVLQQLPHRPSASHPPWKPSSAFKKKEHLSFFSPSRYIGDNQYIGVFSPYWLSPITSFHHIGDNRYYRDILESISNLTPDALVRAEARPPTLLACALLALVRADARPPRTPCICSLLMSLARVPGQRVCAVCIKKISVLGQIQNPCFQHFCRHVWSVRGLWNL
jgi:hypothetical protein